VGGPAEPSTTPASRAQETDGRPLVRRLRPRVRRRPLVRRL